MTPLPPSPTPHNTPITMATSPTVRDQLEAAIDQLRHNAHLVALTPAEAAERLHPTIAALLQQARHDAWAIGYQAGHTDAARPITGPRAANPHPVDKPVDNP